MPISVAAVPAVATSIPIAAVVAVPVAVMPVVPADRSLRLVDSGADGRPDLVPRCLGLRLGAVRCRGDGLPHIPGLATAVAAPIRVAAVPAVIAVAAPIRVAAVPAGVGATFSTTVTAAVVAPTTSVTTVTATAVPTPAAALRIGNVVVDRQEGSRQSAKEWDQCDHDDCQ